MKDCPKCGGYGYDGFDEAGCPFTCYFCGASGQVTDEVATEYEREMYVDPEYRRLLPINTVMYCEHAGEPYTVRRQLMPWQVLKNRAVSAPASWTDIPF